MYINVFLQKTISKLDILYTYSVPEGMDVEIGMRVKIPFGQGNRPKIGIVVEKFEEYNGKYKVKPVLQVIDYEPIIPNNLIQLGFWMVEKYIIGYSNAFSPILPPGDLKKIEKVAYLNEDEFDFKDKNFIGNFTNDEISLLKQLKTDPVIDDVDLKFKKILQKLRDNKVVKIKYNIKTIGGHKTVKMVKLNVDKSINYKTSAKQQLVIDYLRKNGKTEKSKIMKKLDISDSPIKTLEKHNILEIFDEIVEREVYTEKYEVEKHKLNMEQEAAFKGILEKNKRVSLIHGLTGSGKTEVYLSLVEEIIKDGGQVVVLVPEIGLTPQMIERFKGRFFDRVSVFHSKLSTGERFDQWKKIKNGEVDIVVGARSAVFAPFENLKMIIVDEEHDSSYRFHDSLRYDTVDVAIKRMEICKGKVVLGSATPDIISYYNANRNRYALYNLEKRAVKGASLPEISIVDMREELMRGNISIFSENLRFKIEEKLAKKEQIILFLNRRGFSNFVSCRNCGEVIKCENCDISMTYHRNMNILRCHYCGYTKKMPELCPSCGSKFIKQFGIGTQRVEDEVLKLFPEAKVLRMDRDTTNNKDSYDKIYKAVKSGEVDILIGTQMLAKGLDVENVTLVGVIAADLSLFISDYRANETTFQLLTQVSGRAGRGSKKGDVIIQTYNPDNYAIRYAKDVNYIGFYNEEIALRKSFHYPPFANLIKLSFSSSIRDGLDEVAEFILLEILKNVKDFKFEFTDVIENPKIKNIFSVEITLKVAPTNGRKLNNVIKYILDRNAKLLDKNRIFADVEF